MIEIIKTNQEESPGLKNTVVEMKNSLEGFIKRCDQAQKRISELADRTNEIIQCKERKREKLRTMNKTCEKPVKDL